MTLMHADPIAAHLTVLHRLVRQAARFFQMEEAMYCSLEVVEGRTSRSSRDFRPWATSTSILEPNPRRLRWWRGQARCEDTSDTGEVPCFRRSFPELPVLCHSDLAAVPAYSCRAALGCIAHQCPLRAVSASDHATLACDNRAKLLSRSIVR